MRALRCLPMLCALLAAQPAGAEITDLQVTRDGKRYDIRFEALIDAPAERVLHLFSEPGRWTALSKVIKRVERLDESADEKKNTPVSIVFQACVLFLCREADKVSTLVVDTAAGTVIGTSVPGRGDFRYVRERWRIAPHEDGTRLSFTGELEPDFTVPPFIGPLALKSMLRRMLVEMESNLENLAER